MKFKEERLKLKVQQELSIPKNRLKVYQMLFPLEELAQFWWLDQRTFPKVCLKDVFFRVRIRNLGL
jgi:hypothetical protein